MLAPQLFRPFGASVLPSQEAEVIIQKQAALNGVGREVRALISKMPPEVSQGLLSEYGQIKPALLKQMEVAIVERELALEIDENALDKGYFEAAAPQARRMDEVGLAGDDNWDIPAHEM